VGFKYKLNNMLNMDISLEFSIDISGEPGKNTYFGLVSFNMLTKDKVIDELFEKYPEYENKKGSQLGKECHLNIIKFLNEKKVRMVVLYFNKNDWTYYKNKWGSRHDYKERMCAILYFSLIKIIARKNCRYTLISCVESQIGNIERVFNHCKKLADIYKIKLDYNFSRGKYNRSIKIVDYIAYSFRVLKEKELINIEYYIIHNKKIPKKVLKMILK